MRDGAGNGDVQAPTSERALAYCLIPRDLAPRLHETLRHHFRDDISVEVVVEHRTADRRELEDRRVSQDIRSPERRLIRNAHGRRVGERRAPLIAVDLPVLPRRARQFAESVVFVERLEPSTQDAEDLDTARLVIRIQSGDREEIATLYMRYFDRVYSYLRMLLNDSHEAEDLTQQAFVNVLTALPSYERRSQPFRAWLFVVVRNLALNHVRRSNRLEPTDPAELPDPVLSTPTSQLDALRWITDRELAFLAERLPIAQRQVLLLRYMLDLSTAEIADVLGRSPDDVRMLQHRALRFLRHRLTALRAPSERPGRGRMVRRVREATVLRARRYAIR